MSDIQTTDSSFQGGELIAGKYRVDGIIGTGGMGVVVAARHETLGTNVAIKVLREGKDDSDDIRRFTREARATVRLRSEHVARVLDVGTLEDGRPYIVMERLEGRDLRDVLEDSGVLPIEDVVGYVVQACEGLAEAHGAGIVHRDLKPGNLFLTRSLHGQPLVKVLDFGISKLDPRHSDSKVKLTTTGEIFGSPSYMSPEQLRSAKDVDARADIWGLGVVLYELLTGELPFYADTVYYLVLVISNEPPPPPRTLRAEIPEGLERVVLRCLEKRPQDRFQSVVEVVEALEPYTRAVNATAADRVRALAGQSVAPTRQVTGQSVIPPAPRVEGGSWRAGVAVALLFVAGVGGLGARYLFHARGHAPATAEVTEPLQTAVPEPRAGAGGAGAASVSAAPSDVPSPPTPAPTLPPSVEASTATPRTRPIPRASSLASAREVKPVRAPASAPASAPTPAPSRDPSISRF